MAGFLESLYGPGAEAPSSQGACRAGFRLYAGGTRSAACVPEEPKASAEAIARANECNYSCQLQNPPTCKPGESPITSADKCCPTTSCIIRAGATVPGGGALELLKTSWPLIGVGALLVAGFFVFRSPSKPLQGYKPRRRRSR